MRLLALGAFVAALVTSLFLAASWLSLGRGGDERVADAFQRGLLGTEIAGDLVPVQRRFNDCLITAMALEQRQPRELLTISPVNPAEPMQEVCGDLRANSGPNAAAFYHNYLHGQTVLLRFLLPHLGLGEVMGLYKVLISLVLLGTLFLCMVRLLDGRLQVESILFLIAAVGFARFFGLEWFSDALGHGPSDLVLVAFLAVMAARSASMGAAEWVAGTALFGALTMIFELLTGGLPLGAALVLGLGWFALDPRERSPARVGLGLVSFGMGAAVPVLTKLVLVASVFGMEAVTGIGAQGLKRVGSAMPEGFESLNAPAQLIVHLGSLAPGLWLVSAGTLFVALCVGAVSLLRCRDPEYLLLAGSAALIFLWPVLFRSHTALHASFMARIFVWPLIAGFALFALTAMRASKSRRGAAIRDGAG